MSEMNRRKVLLAGSSLVAWGLLPSRANALVSKSIQQETATVNNFGAVGDGTVDDSVSIQAAIDSVVISRSELISRGHISFSGSCVYKISTQLEVNKKSIRFEGNNAVLQWFGPVASAMIHVTDSTRCQFENLILLGQLRPLMSSAFYFEGKKSSVLGVNRDIVIDGCMIGRKFSTDTTTGGTADATPYAGFKNGIVVGGVDGNNDAYTIKNTEINSCHDELNFGKAISFLSTQSIWSSIQDCLVNDSDIGVYLGCDIQMRNISANRCKVVDIWGIRNIWVNILGFNAENSLTFIKSTGGASFSVNGGKLLRNNAISSNFFRWENGGGLVLENLLIFNTISTADTIYYRVGQQISGIIRVRNCRITNGSNRDTWDIDTGGLTSGSYIIDIKHDQFIWKTTKPYLDRYIKPLTVSAFMAGTVYSGSGNTPVGEFFQVAYQYDLKGQHLVSAFHSPQQICAKILNTTAHPMTLTAGRFRWMGLSDYIVSHTMLNISTPVIRNNAVYLTTLTLPGVQLGDFVIFSSGAAYSDQVVTAYVSRINTVTLQVYNASGNTVGQTSADFYVGKLKEFGRFQNTHNYIPTSINHMSTVLMTVDILGVQLGAHTFVSYSNDLKGLLCTSYVSAANVVTILLTNYTGQPVLLDAGFFKIMAAF